MDESRRRLLRFACGLGAAVLGGGLLARRILLHEAAIQAVDAGEGVRGDRRTPEADLTEAMYYEPLVGRAVACRLCFRQCIIADGRRGFCQVRENRGGRLYTLVFNRPCALQIDPIEKEPLYHFLPGTTIFCLSTASCNYRCRFCHNWHISYSAPE